MPDARVCHNTTNSNNNNNSCGCGSGSIPANTNFSEAVCINAPRIYDSCSDKDCLEDLQVFFTEQGQCVIDTALTVKIKDVEVLNVIIDVDEVPFNRGFYSIDLTFYFDVTADVYTSPVCQPITLHGLASFSKKVILYGSEGNVKTFTSTDSGCKTKRSSNMPKVSLSVVDPIALGVRVVDFDSCGCCECLNGVPENVACYYEGNFAYNRPDKIVYVTIGLFSIVSIEREVQMLIPAYDYCIPDKSCDGQCSGDDPCDMFRRIKFPTSQFFPPKLNDNCCD